MIISSINCQITFITAGNVVNIIFYLFPCVCVASYSHDDFTFDQWWSISLFSFQSVWWTKKWYSKPKLSQNRRLNTWDIHTKTFLSTNEQRNIPFRLIRLNFFRFGMLEGILLEFIAPAVFIPVWSFILLVSFSHLFTWNNKIGETQGDCNALFIVYNSMRSKRNKAKQQKQTE